MSTRNRWIVVGLAVGGVALLAGAYPAAQLIKERHQRALQKLRQDLAVAADLGARGQSHHWNDAPLPVSEDLLEPSENGEIREVPRDVRDAALLGYKPYTPFYDPKADPGTQLSSDSNGRGPNSPGTPPDNLVWVNIGPTDARFEVNGGVYFQNDSGRATYIHNDPRDANILYHSTATGGIWKTYDALDDDPTWIPIGESANLSVGAFDVAKSAPDTLYLAAGDAYDTTQGGQIWKSTNAGGNWTLVTAQLSGTYPPGAGGRTEYGLQMRDLKIDPTNPNIVLVGTEVGLFRSQDGGQNFNLLFLATFPNNQVDREYNISSIVYTGTAGGESQWLAMGQPACGTPEFPITPRRGIYGQAVGTVGCPDGNRGDIWKSTDSGRTWSSRRVAGRFDYGDDYDYIVNSPWTDIGRGYLAASNTVDPARTVVYVWAEADRELAVGSQPGLLAVLKSVDGGEHFTVAGTGRSPVTNRTTSGDCPNLDVGKGQGWYNQMVAVDPVNPNNVLIGGQLCSARSRDGGRTWDNVSHWLPHAGGGTTNDGRLPYVHADWHAGLIYRVGDQGDQIIAFAGTDGGSFRATNLFTIDRAVLVDWKSLDRGLATHQFYSIASGDPAFGDPFIAFGGLQDNGTRIRDDDPILGKPTTFNQVVGGDGVATMLARATLTVPPSDRRLFFTALPGSRQVCRTPVDADACNVQSGGWAGFSVSASTGDSQPFLIKYASLPRADPTGSDQVITNTTLNIHRIYVPPSGSPTVSSVRLTTWTDPNTPGSFFIEGAPPCMSLLTVVSINQCVRNVHTSPKVFSDDQGTFRLIGVSLGNGYYSVGKDRSPDDSTVDITWTNGPTPVGIGPADNQKIPGTTSVAFPSDATHVVPSGVDGSVYLASVNSGRMFDNTTLVTPEVGHLFLTTDGGQTWTPFHGDGSGLNLPNVPVNQVVFDPGDSSDQTIYVLTDIGVFRSTDQGATWRRFGSGLPNAPADMMFIATNGGLIRIGGYGRGVWEIYPNANAERGVPGDGDWDRNLQIDFLDLGALASRLGTSTETTEPPLFDWNLALGDTNAITESDLVAVLNKFGNHP